MGSDNEVICTFCGRRTTTTLNYGWWLLSTGEWCCLKQSCKEEAKEKIDEHDDDEDYHIVY